MAVRFCHTFPSTLSSPPFRSSRTITTRSTASSSSSTMELHNQGRSKLLELPFVSAPHRQLMVDLVSTVENRLGSQLLPCTLPLDVQHCQNESGTAQASLYIRSGHLSSPVDFILGSWLHCELPTGAALNITSFSAYLNHSTDAPNFIMELVRSSPTSLVLILDLPPRKDLVLYPDYLRTFYENSQLETQNQTLEKLKEVQPYVSSSLYFRSLLSPTRILIRVETDAAESGRMEEIIKDNIDPVVKEVVGIWLETCACGGREVDEEERAYLKKRDELVKKKYIEIDLAANLPKFFGPEITDRVLGAIQKIYNV